MTMRAAALTMLVMAAGCESNPAAPRVVAATPRTDAEIATALEPRGWARVVARAQPLFAPGASTTPAVDPGFDGALEIAFRQSQAWRDRRKAYKDQVAAVPITEFAESGPAIAALVHWASVGGAIPVADPDSPTAIAPMSLAMVAIITSGADTLEGLLAAAALGRRLLMEGPSLVDAMLGVGMLRAALTRSTLLQRPLPGSIIPPDEVVVRGLASEAVTMRREFGNALTADGIAKANAKGTPLAERDAQLTMSMLGARDKRWVMIIDELAQVTARDELATTLAAFVIEPDALGGSDPALDMQASVATLIALLDDLHAQVAR